VSKKNRLTKKKFWTKKWSHIPALVLHPSKHPCRHLGCNSSNESNFPASNNAKVRLQQILELTHPVASICSCKRKTRT
jgi:hypothetical protein